MGITITRPVHVKVVVTEPFKKKRAAEIRAALARVDAILKRIELRLNKTGGRTERSAETPEPVAERLRAEKRKNEQARAALVRELEKVSSLEVGTHYDRGVLEGTVEVEVGDDFSKLGVCEIVVEDDKIVEIRDGLCPEVNETSS